MKAINSTTAWQGRGSPEPFEELERILEALNDDELIDALEATSPTALRHGRRSTTSVSP